MNKKDFSQYVDDINTFDIFPNGKIFRLTYDQQVRKIKLLSKNYKYIEDIRKAFSIENPNSFFIKQYGYKSEPRLYQINKFGYFSIGLVFDVLTYIKNTFGTLDCVAISKNFKTFLDDIVTPLKKYIYKDNRNHIDISNVSDDLGRNNELKLAGKNQYNFRDYQKSAIDFLINTGYGRGLIEIPTAGGKSFILANFIWNILKNINRNFKTLILVPNKQLVEQFHKDLLDYGFNKYEITKFTAGLKKHEAYNQDAKIIIANRQFVFKNKTKLPDVDILICDEVHQCCSPATVEFIDNIDSTVKIGCSGTIPRGKYDRWQLIGMFGKIVYTQDIVNLQEAGYISKLKITTLKITDCVVEADKNCLFNLNSKRKYCPDEFGYSQVAFNEAHDAEHEYYSKHYQDLYKPVLNYIKTLSENTLILFDRIEVGTNLFNLSKELISNKDIHYIDGSIDVSIRERIRNKLEQSGNNILFAENAVFSTGINIKRLTHIVFACGTKSFSRVLQSIGRTLRLHESKQEAHLVEVVFNFKYSTKHYNERLKIYKDSYKKKPDEVFNFTIN